MDGVGEAEGRGDLMHFGHLRVVVAVGKERGMFGAELNHEDLLID